MEHTVCRTVVPWACEPSSDSNINRSQSAIVTHLWHFSFQIEQGWDLVIFVHWTLGFWCLEHGFWKAESAFPPKSTFSSFFRRMGPLVPKPVTHSPKQKSVGVNGIRSWHLSQHKRQHASVIDKDQAQTKHKVPLYKQWIQSTWRVVPFLRHTLSWQDFPHTCLP